MYRALVRTALVHGTDAWALNNAQGNKWEVAEMRMLRWVCGEMKLDKTRNEKIRGTTKVEEIGNNVQERRSKW